jgi:thiamine pyrophosphate-dependent acetolactate synthase large subunit-like protein
MVAMNKMQAVEVLVGETDFVPVVWTTGYVSRIARARSARGNDFYMTGSMGIAASIGTGVALATHRTVVVVDGDGSLLMNPASLVVAGAVLGLPLVHVVLDDGIYASTGGQFVPSSTLDIGQWAHHAGYQDVACCVSQPEFQDALRRRLLTDALPTFIHCRLEPDATPIPPRVEEGLADIARRFSGHLSGSSA